MARSHAAAIRRAHEIIHDAVEQTGLGRVEGRLTETDWPDDLSWGWHHMGTTHMHDDRKQGVEDKNCKVHGIANLLVSGSSVFPTGGKDLPTLTIVALATRLADYIKRTLQGAGTATAGLA